MTALTRSLFKSAAMVAAFGLGSSLLATTARAGDEVPYQGGKSCKKCHSQHNKSWEATKMGVALNILKPNERATS